MIVRIIYYAVSLFRRILKIIFLLPVNSVIDFFNYKKNWQNSIILIAYKLKNLILAAFFLNSLNCSQLSIYEERDNIGRVVRSVSHIKDVPDTITIIKYVAETNKPLSKEYIKLKNGAPFHNWIETYSYNRGRISIIKFFIYIKETKIKSGEIIYKYSDENTNAVEYYSLLHAKNKSLFMHGLDLYNYSVKDLINRRIIEYEQNPETMISIQISQYVINYFENKITSMETRILDKKSNSIITNQETDLKIIQEMIGNIEKSLKDRCKGYKLYKRKNIDNR